MSDLLGMSPDDFDPPSSAVERTALEAAQGVPMRIVAEGQHVGLIGTAEELAATAPGAATLAEGESYDPARYPDLSAKLAPFYGSTRVPSLSRPEWL